MKANKQAIPDNAIIVPIDFKGKRSFSNKEWGEIKDLMKGNKMDFQSAYDEMMKSKSNPEDTNQLINNP